MLFHTLLMQAGNLYNYIETLPPSISQRDYSRFKSPQDISAYVDSCLVSLNKLDPCPESSVDEYVRFCVELHDIVDQFPELYADTSLKPHLFTIRALVVLERRYGRQSAEFARFFADYLLYDCNDKVSVKLSSNIAIDGFDADSAYYEHVAYKLNRLSDVDKSSVSLAFSSKNADVLIPFTSPLYKELLLMKLLMGNKVRNVDGFVKMILTQYAGNESGSVLDRKLRLLDCTGLLLSLYDEDLDEESKSRLRTMCLEYAGLFERGFVKIAGDVSISRQANAIHVLAYLQGWKKFLSNREGMSSTVGHLDRVADVFYGHLELEPRSYREAFERFKSDEEVYFRPELPGTLEDNELLYKFLLALNVGVKKDFPFDKIDSLLPPILQWKEKELQKKKVGLNALDYCLVCLDYIDKYLDTEFTWDIGDGTDEDMERRKARKELLLNRGWTGKQADGYIASSNILDFAIEYMINISGYNVDASPGLMYRAAKRKFEQGDLERALLYSVMANDIFEICDRLDVEWADNKRILTIARDKVENNDTGYERLARWVAKFEVGLRDHFEEEQTAGYCDFLVRLYCTLSEHDRSRGDLDNAVEWTEKALDFIYLKEGSVWAPKDGSYVLTPAGSAIEIPVRYQQWKNALSRGRDNECDSLLEEAYNAVYDYILFNRNSFGFHDTAFVVAHEYYGNWSNRNRDDEDKDVSHEVKLLSNDVRETLKNYAARMHPRARTSYYNLAQKALREYNGILANRDTVQGAESICDNLLVSRGLKLLDERLLKQGLMNDEECKRIQTRITNLEGVNKEELKTLFREDYYGHKLEERALTSQGLLDILAVSYSDIKEHLGEKSVVVEFFKAPFWNDAKYGNGQVNDEYGFWAVLMSKTGSVGPIPLCDSSQLPVIPSKGPSTETMEQLSSLIWHPLLPYLDVADTIYIVPDAELHNCPVEYLPCGENQYMCDRYDMRRISSAKEIMNENSVRQPWDIALFGNMFYDDDQAYGDFDETGDVSQFDAPLTTTADLLRGMLSKKSYLEGTLHEIEEIEELFVSKGLQCKMHSGMESTEKEFRKLDGKMPGIVHLATHGCYWPYIDLTGDLDLSKASFLKDETGRYAFGDPLNRSVVLFTGANATLGGEQRDRESDGILTARELSGMDLSAVKLFVLSACQTALGDIEEDGVFGLQRAIKQAGGNAILMSLWEVNDSATMELMTSFYENLLSGMGMGEALQRARKKLRDNDLYAHPKFWAPFILLDALD